MSFDFTEDEFENESGSGSKLREKLEETLSTNKELMKELAFYKAKDVINAKGFNLVKPEDLEGVALDKLEERAEALQAERQDLQKSLVQDIFKKQGLEGEELEAAVQAFIGGEVTPPTGESTEAAETVERVRSLQGIDSLPAATTPPSQLHGIQAIEYGLAQGKRRKA